ncbi:MAG: GntP family permease [Gemmataceae bacterium]|nr:GntP family permease [Gemmataceae bacterium]
MLFSNPRLTLLPALSPWAAICCAAALVLLLVLIIRWKVHAFLALLLVSLGMGLAAGLPPERVVTSIGKGVGDIMANVAVLLALGAVLGRMLDLSGAAQVIARTLINTFGVGRASLAILVAAYLVGIPVLFNVGFLLLLPIMWRLQRDTGRSLLWFVLPLAFSLGITHSLVPPHPGIVGAVSALTPEGKRSLVMVETILFGTLMGIPLVLAGWLIPGRWWASRQMVVAPEHLSLAEPPLTLPSPPPGGEGRVREGDLQNAPPPSFAVSLLIVVLPLVQSLAGFGVKLLGDLGHLPGWMARPLFNRADLPDELALLANSPAAWLQFLGQPEMALLVPTLLAFWLLGRRRGMPADKLAKAAGDALTDVGGILFLFGAAGGFKEVIQVTGAGDYIAAEILGLGLPKVLMFYLVAVLMRVALGSATAAILTASALLAEAARALPGHETLLVLAVANGVTFMTQPADSGFWMVKEYCNLSVRDVMVRFNACRIFMSLVGLLLLLGYELWVGG